MITRAELCGAIKVLNATGVKPRLPALRAMLKKEHSDAQVEKVVLDLPTYPEWVARMDLDCETIPDPASPVVEPSPLPRKKSGNKPSASSAKLKSPK